MHFLRLLAVTVATGLLLGCGGGHEPVPVASAPPAQSSSMPLLAPAAAGPTPDAAAQSGAAPSPPPPAVDFTSARRELDKNGTPISDLELLNQAIMTYSSAAMSSVPSSSTGTFKDPDAQTAAISKQYESHYRTLNSLSDLVKAGIIKALPAAPPGKQYVLDPKTKLAVMVDQK